MDVQYFERVGTMKPFPGKGLLGNTLPRIPPQALPPPLPATVGL